MSGRRLSIDTDAGKVSARLHGSGGPVVVLAHGAGADMDAPLLVGFAEGLAEAGIGCLRFNFPYTEAGRRAPDREPVLRATWRAAFERGASVGQPVWVAGKSLGGRIASMEVADGLPAAGIVLLGYPLHPPGKPDRLRVEHLLRIRVPILFLQGTADALARWDLVEDTVKRLGDVATIHPIEGGDHSFRVRGRKRDAADIGRELAGIAATFIRDHGEAAARRPAGA